MIQVTFRRLELKKLYPLTISRGTQAVSENLFVFASDGVHTGIGELAPATANPWTADSGEPQLRNFVGEGLSSEELIDDVYERMRQAKVDPPAMAALDVALWDLLAKKGGLPLRELLGLGRPTEQTSVTIGINPPEVIRERVPDILERTGAKCLKIKLGCPDGIDRDKENFLAAMDSSRPFNSKLRVDANGGWSVTDARHMMRWLADRGVDYVEQPLVEGAEEDLPAIFHNRPLPIFADESCRFSQSVPRLADRVDGVNLKLMKCGGITEALRIVATAREHGLKTMIGCMSESSIAIAAGATIGALFDHIDLDSHLNLNPDPAGGTEIVEGVVIAREAPGHGGFLKETHA